jgi:putative oxygen-independent coproporphyrinogen III oxidase
MQGELPESRYVDALLRDLATEATAVENRTIQTMFLGGGTPSLFSPESIARLLTRARNLLAIAPDAEVTLEANPGTVDVSRFRGFRDAGVNRLSIGVQSFEAEKLMALGRIHGVAEALAAAGAAREAGFANFNLDLMYGLPGQTVEQAAADVGTAIALHPAHLSVYQLTLEPNTAFHQHPPPLPDEDTIEEMRRALVHRLEQNGYDQYEVSAYAQPGSQCRHNRNYWEFGDYLGIGAGAHGKISSADKISRTAKTRHPQAYLRDTDTGTAGSVVRTLAAPDLICEFMLNALRLRHGFPLTLFAERTGLALDAIATPLQIAQERGLLELDSDVRTTPLGRRFLNDLTMLFLP